MDLLINTAAVLSTAEQIDTINKQIRDDLADVDNAIKALQQSWESEAAGSCSNKYEYIKRSFSDRRFSVVNQMVSFLKNQVGEGYETTEKTLSSAASAFK